MALVDIPANVKGVGGTGKERPDLFPFWAWFRSCTHCSFLFLSDQKFDSLLHLAAREAWNCTIYSVQPCAWLRLESYSTIDH